VQSSLHQILALFKPMHQIKCANSGGCLVIAVLVFCRIMALNSTWKLATADLCNLTFTLTGYRWEGGK